MRLKLYKDDYNAKIVNVTTNQVIGYIILETDKYIYLDPIDVINNYSNEQIALILLHILHLYSDNEDEKRLNMIEFFNYLYEW